MSQAAMKLGPAPAIAPGSIVWCRARTSYEQRKLIRWEHDAHRGWCAHVQGRSVTIVAEHVFSDRVKCHDSLIKDLEAKYQRHVVHCRKLRQQLDGLKNTRRESWSRYLGKIGTGAIK